MTKQWKHHPETNIMKMQEWKVKIKKEHPKQKEMEYQKMNSIRGWVME